MKSVLLIKIKEAFLKESFEMQKIKQFIAEKVEAYLEEKGVAGVEVSKLFSTPTDSTMGDIALPCFKFSAVLRKSPVMIAEELVSLFSENEMISKAEALKGYLNFFVNKSYYKSALSAIVNNENYGKSDVGAGKTVCLDFSSPNIAKRFHVGHLGTTVIGNSLKRIHQFCGFDVVGINHLGDWGTQFGKLIVAYKKWGSKEKIEERGVSELADLYVRFCNEAENDDSLNDEARKAFAKLEEKYDEYMEIWQYFKEISLKEYQKTYDLLGVEFESWNGESFFNDKMDAVVEELRQSGLLTVDDGASIVRLDEYNMPPALILKRDGATLYATRDITAAIWRKGEYDFHKCLYVTSAGQSLHFAQYFKVLELMGKEWAKDLVHVPYGTMSMGGEKLASRTGNIILLDDLFDDAIEKAEKIIDEKNSGLKDKRKVAEAVGVGAIVFWALSGSRIKDTDFSWETALSFEGNAGPYVQYTYARASSILRKSTVDCNNFGDYEPCSEEIEVIKKLLTFPTKVLQALDEYEPSVISRYALEFCALFNSFYHNCRIIGAEENVAAFRVSIAKAAVDVLGKCLDLLGMRRTEEI